jgi:hypothetical protein
VTRVVPSLGFDEKWGLLVPAAATLLRAPVDSVTVDGLGRVFVPALPETYGLAESGGSEPDGSGFCDGPTAADTRLPAVVDERVRRLARDLEKEPGSVRDRVARTIAHLQAPPYRYTLEVGRFQTKDPVAEFLLDKKAGYCEYFATAAAMLLRLQGVPTRFVKGVRVRAESAIAGHYVVRESDAHAWVEAFVTDGEAGVAEGAGGGDGEAGVTDGGRGAAVGAGSWIELDPTPPAEYASLHASPKPGPIEESLEALQTRVAEGWLWFRLEGWPRATAWANDITKAIGSSLMERPALAASSLALVMLVLAGFRMRVAIGRIWAARRRRSRRASAEATAVSPELRRLLATVERLWSQRGAPRPSARGLQEHLASLPPEALTAEETRLSAMVIESYYRASFGGHAPAAADSYELASLLTALDARRRR